METRVVGVSESASESVSECIDRRHPLAIDDRAAAALAAGPTNRPRGRLRREPARRRVARRLDTLDRVLRRMVWFFPLSEFEKCHGWAVSPLEP